MENTVACSQDPCLGPSLHPPPAPWDLGQLTSTPPLPLHIDDNPVLPTTGSTDFASSVRVDDVGQNQPSLGNSVSFS